MVNFSVEYKIIKLVKIQVDGKLEIGNQVGIQRKWKGCKCLKVVIYGLGESSSSK